MRGKHLFFFLSFFSVSVVNYRIVISNGRKTQLWRTFREGREGEWRKSSTHSTSAPGGDQGLSCYGRFVSGKQTRYPLNRRLGGGAIASLDIFEDEKFPNRVSNSGLFSLAVEFITSMSCRLRCCAQCNQTPKSFVSYSLVFTRYRLPCH